MYNPIWYHEGRLYFRTVTNCNPTPAKVQKVENEEPGSDVASGSGGGGTGVEEPGIVDKKDFRELSETPKLLPKPTRCVREEKMSKDSFCP